MCRADSNLAAPGSTVGQVLDGCAQTLQGLLLHDLLRSSQCHDIQAQAPPLQVEHLVEDEGLGEAREAVDQDNEIDRPATSIVRIAAFQSINTDEVSGGGRPGLADKTRSSRLGRLPGPWTHHVTRAPTCCARGTAPRHPCVVPAPGRSETPPATREG